MDLKHIFSVEVAPDWVDYNGHMNDAAYALVFSRAVDQLMIELGMDAEFREKTKFTIYTLSVLIHYREEGKNSGKSLILHCNCSIMTAKDCGCGWICCATATASLQASNCWSASINPARPRARRRSRPKSRL